MKNFGTSLLFVSALGLIAACGEDEAPTLSVDVFGWTGSEFVSGLPDYNSAQTVLVTVTQPATGRTVSQSSAPVATGGLSIPEIEFGNDLRLELDVLDGLGETLASGATAEFDYEAGLPSRRIRLQVQAINEFAPVGNVVLDASTNERRFAQTRFDYSGLGDNAPWRGRAGHAVAEVSDGRLLVVGGGNIIAGSADNVTPFFESVYNDIQVFSPETGYFTNIDFDGATGALLGRDVLADAVVYPTLTAIGDDRFLVAGGFKLEGEELSAVSTIQLIDLNATPGERVTSITGADGQPLSLRFSRGRHTATLRTIDNNVVIIGGLGAGGDNDTLDVYEVIDVERRTVSNDRMQASRAQHAATLMGDGSTIWVTGGVDESTVLSSTETLVRANDGTTSSQSEANMTTPRFAHGATKISSGAGDLILVVGGFVDVAGDASNRFGVSRMGRGQFDSGSDWALSGKRGGVEIVELPNTKDVLVFGGRDESSIVQTTVERLSFESLASDPPYQSATIGDSPDARYQPSVTLMSSGQVLLVGGEGIINGGGTGLDTAEIFNPLDPRSVVTQ